MNPSPATNVIDCYNFDGIQEVVFPVAILLLFVVDASLYCLVLVSVFGSMCNRRLYATRIPLWFQLVNGFLVAKNFPLVKTTNDH